MIHIKGECKDADPTASLLLFSFGWTLGLPHEVPRQGFQRGVRLPLAGVKRLLWSGT